MKTKYNCSSQLGYPAKTTDGTWEGLIYLWINRK
jgi:hypothetical protein